MGSSRVSTSQEPLRRCVSCRTLAPRSQFWRVVRTASPPTIQLDQGMGRSAYLCRTAQCLQEAQKRNRLGRSLRHPIPPHLYETLWQRLHTAASPPTPPVDSRLNSES